MLYIDQFPLFAVRVEVEVARSVDIGGDLEDGFSDEPDGGHGDEGEQEEGNNGRFLVFRYQRTDAELPDHCRDESYRTEPERTFQGDKARNDVLHHCRERRKHDDERRRRCSHFWLHTDFQHIGHIDHT